MIPLRDKNPSNITPWLVYALIAANVLAFLFELSLDTAAWVELLRTYGFVAHTAKLTLQGEAGLLMGLAVPAFTCMFLHGGWLHLIGNMWFLHIFGDNIEARLGRMRFALFYLACGLAASGTQYFLDPDSTMPMVGASGAIAGVLGGYILCWPRARITTLVPIFYLITFIDLPAVAVLGLWFIMQFFGGIASLGTDVVPVAYGAHIGGFVAGLVLIKLIPQARPKKGPRKITRLPRRKSRNNRNERGR